MGDYILKKKIGKGQFSSAVYRGENKVTGAVVAVKEIEIFDANPDERLSILHEVELLKVRPPPSPTPLPPPFLSPPPNPCVCGTNLAKQSFDHPNIIKYLESFINEDDKKLYVVMEYAEAGDLKKLIERAATRRAPLAERTIWKVFFQIINGLRYMHSHRILHRDLKPANVFVSSGGKAKLGDLGLGRELSSSSKQAHTRVGTPYYMSPERISEEGYSLSSDIWSLGCILYEMAALHNPFFREGLDLVSLISLITTAEYQPLPDTYSEELRSLVDAMLVLDPDARPTAKDVFRIARSQVESLLSSSSSSR